jgi:hypothetical protein
MASAIQLSDSDRHVIVCHLDQETRDYIALMTWRALSFSPWEQGKQDRAAARDADTAERHKKKEDERLAKEREAKYPIDDALLKLELVEEARSSGVPIDELLKPLPEPAALEDGPLVAEEAALAEFLQVFGQVIDAPKSTGTSQGLRAVIVGCGPQLVELYQSLLECAMEPGVSGKGRAVARWRRVLAEATWPEVVRLVLARSGSKAAGSKKKADGGDCQILPAMSYDALSTLVSQDKRHPMTRRAISARP